MNGLKRYPKEYMPVIYEVDMDSHEASGIVHPFCSDQCRGDATILLPKGFMSVGGLDRIESFPDDTHCEKCFAEIKETR